MGQHRRLHRLQGGEDLVRGARHHRLRTLRRSSCRRQWRGQRRLGRGGRGPRGGGGGQEGQEGQEGGEEGQAEQGKEGQEGWQGQQQEAGQEEAGQQQEGLELGRSRRGGDKIKYQQLSNLY